MMRVYIFLIAVTLWAGVGVAVGQTTVATPGATRTTRAAGMALQDGTLPPGTLTARIVQGSFSGNLAGVKVTLEVSGESGEQATTGGDGRAQFAHLTIGSTVRVTATVGGEPLESESIVMPAESGVRVLLVAGDQFVDTSTAGEVAALPSLGDAPAFPKASVAPSVGSAAEPSRGPSPAPNSRSGHAIARFRVLMIALTSLAFVAVGYRQWRRRS